MKIHIDTIPVWDAMRKGEACFLCTVAERAEKTWTERFLGGSVMEPDWRIRVNARGFCSRHHQLLYGMGNRLGHALMLESHTAEASRSLKALLVKLKQAADGMDSGLLGTHSRSGRKAREAYDSALSGLGELAESCIFCESMAADMESYLCTAVHLWKNDQAFRASFANCRGVCLPHARDLVRCAPQMLDPRDLSAFLKSLAEVEGRCFGTVQEDISWFIKKFDYRYQAEPWKNAQDAVPRAVNALRGRTLEDKSAQSGSGDQG